MLLMDMVFTWAKILIAIKGNGNLINQMDKEMPLMPME